jgi:hypothetical protein
MNMDMNMDMNRNWIIRISDRNPRRGESGVLTKMNMIILENRKEV